ncbi:hypothetical protein A4G99_05005 [Haladaptatus sp. R4]|uniref:alpha/beta fold hydrolase n=1 Tax=Haladaptatus sp. R4 TaxID=1679489 RepID=UPI0007B4DD62|nr:alpha/beta fold hydrolase [Haladaptatus sp. R4]KZN25790.1 hypothetical protein A4G99_05005 [Haladaptatus sp. R4]
MGEAFLSGRSIRTDRVTGELYSGLGPGPHPGVLILHGSGGAGEYERTYAARLAEHGYTAFCVSYFGAPGVSNALAEIPLSRFRDAAEWLLKRPNAAGTQVGVVGFSRGGEAALLAASHFERLGAVAAYVPSCYSFPAPTWMAGVEEECAAWTVDGEPVPYLPVERYVAEQQDGLTDALEKDAPDASTMAIEGATDERLDEATIEVENIEGPVTLISGGSDEVWPSAMLADRVAERLERHDHPCTVEHRSYPDAGHAIRVPYRFGGNDPADGEHRFGGTNRTNAFASADAWYHVLRCLKNGLDPNGDSRR